MIRIFFAFSSTTLLILSFPSFDIGFLASISLVSLLLSIKNGSLKSALILSWIRRPAPPLFVAREHLRAPTGFRVYYSPFADGPTHKDWVGDSLEHSLGRELRGFSNFEIVRIRG